KAFLRIAGAPVEERGYEVDEREDGREGEKRRELPGEGIGAEESDGRRPESEGRDGQRSKRRRRREVSEKGDKQVETDGERVPVERHDRRDICDRRERESEHGCPSRRVARGRDQDQREIERVRHREHDIRAALLLDVPDAGGGDDPRRRERQRGSEESAGGHATTEGSGVTCQRGVSATLV